MKRLLTTLFLVFIGTFVLGQSDSSVHRHLVSPTLEITAGTYWPIYEDHVSRRFNGGGTLLLGIDVRTEHGLISLATGIRIGNHHYLNTYLEIGNHHYLTTHFELNALFWGIPLFVGYQYDIGAGFSIYGKASYSDFKVANVQLIGNSYIQHEVDDAIRNSIWRAVQVELGMNWQFHSKLSLRAEIFSDIPLISNSLSILRATFSPIIGLKVGLKWNVLY